MGETCWVEGRATLPTERESVMWPEEACMEGETAAVLEEAMVGVQAEGECPCH